MNPHEEFRAEVAQNIEGLKKDEALHRSSIDWVRETGRHRYTYNFRWMGRPIIQFPQDIVALQEVVWETRPDVIIETGIAHGGSLILSASMLALLGGDGRVLGVDIDIRDHNREAIESHPMASRIRMFEGSSIDPEILESIRAAIPDGSRVMVILDSNHTHEHVLRELELYSPLVTRDCYLVVFDTVVDDMPADYFPDRPWGEGDNPRTAVREFLASTNRFVADRDIDRKLLITVAPEGYLRCVKDGS